MKKILDTAVFWLKAARVHSLPMAFMSWIVVFCFALKSGGDVIHGILALIGLLFAQLGVNLGDDYIDYKREAFTIKEGQKGKCEYLLDGRTTINHVLAVVIFYFSVPFLIGIYFTIVCGWQCAAIAFAAGIICLFYPYLTYFGLGEIAVGVNFAPLLFAGTYFVMTGSYSVEAMLISVSTGLLTVVLLHVHTLMDYDFDIKENKKTLCAILQSKTKAFYALVVMIVLAYVNIWILVGFKIISLKFLITMFSAPMAIGLLYLMRNFVDGSSETLEKKWWMGPIEHFEDIKKKNAQNFMVRFYLARNLMCAFSLLVCIALFI